MASALERWGIGVADWWAAQLSRHQDGLHQLNTPDLASLVMACAIARQKPEKAWISAFQQETGARLAQAAQGDAAAFSPQSMCVTLSALCQLRVKPDKEWLASFLAAVSASSASAANAAAARQEAVNLASQDTSATHLVRPKQAAGLQSLSAPPFSAQGLATIIQGLGRMKAKPGPEWLGFFCTIATPHIASMRETELMDLCIGLAATRCRPPPEMTRLVAARLARLAPHMQRGRVLTMQQALKRIRKRQMEAVKVQ